VRLSDGRRGVVVSVPQTSLDRPVVRVGWDPRGNTVSPYELDMATEPDELALTCVAAPGVPEHNEPPPPPMPTRPEPLVSPATPVRRVSRERAWR
jgi:hypothetical protein